MDNELFQGLLEVNTHKNSAPLNGGGQKNKNHRDERKDDKKTDSTIQQKKSNKKKHKQKIENENKPSENKDVNIDNTANTANSQGANVFLDNIDKACNGNEYLKGMIMGEILNSPRFKGRR